MKKVKTEKKVPLVCVRWHCALLV